ncbi:MAG: hypothetical protein K2J30_02725, partial [Clostridia bacterium]|nr:hypothetical protein [Clostridia bacterium]
MIARIKTKNGFYDSVVFALFKKGWKSSVVAFNEDHSAIEFVKMWTPNRTVFLYDIEKGDDWLVKKNTEGYSWALKSIRKRLFKPVTDQSILDNCKTLQQTVESHAWFEIKNKSDIDGLMECALTFHDAFVKKIYREGDKQYILFDTTWGCEILFELDGSVETNLFENYGHMQIDNDFPIIFDSAMFIENGLIY